MNGRAPSATSPAGRRGVGAGLRGSVRRGGSARGWMPIGLALTIASSTARSVGAQDFDLPSFPGPSATALGLLEHGLAADGRGIRLDASVTRWFAFPDLTTRSLAAGLGLGAVRSALGVSQTGEPPLGWSALGLALGGGGQAGAVALRVTARRDHDPAAVPSPLGAGIGAEAGGGAWLNAEPLVIWASAPQLWVRGVAPPLARPLEVGGSIHGPGIALSFSHSGPLRGRGMTGGHAVALGLGADAWRIWFEARDRPLRGMLGVSASVRIVVLAAGVEGHPVLGETVRLAISLASDRRPL